MENYGDAMKYAQTSANSAGTAWEKYSTSYLNSIEAKTNALTAQFESLSQSVLDSDLVKGFVDLMTNVVKVLESILGIGDGVLLKITLFIASMAALYIALTRAAAGIHKLNLKLLATRVCIARAAKQTSVFNATLSTLNINPVILAITAVTAVVVGLGVAFEAAEKKAREKFEKIVADIEKSAEAISKFDDEIESLESLQSKLADAQGDHKKLASIYDELNDKVGASINLLKGEEAAYAAVSLKLKDQIASVKKLREEELRNKIAQAKAGFSENRLTRKPGFGFDFELKDATGEQMRALMRGSDDVWDEDYYQKRLNWYNGVPGAFSSPQNFAEFLNYDIFYNQLTESRQKDLLTIMGVSIKDWESYWDDQVAIANEVFADYIASSDPRIKELLTGSIDRLIRSGYNLDETEAAMRELYASGDVIQEYYDALASGDGASEAYSRVVDEFDALIQKYPELKDKIESFVAGISGPDDVSNIELRLNSVSDVITSIKDKYDLLSSSLKDMEDLGIVSADNIVKLLEEYPTLEKYVTKTKNGYVMSDSALSSYKDSLIKQQKAIVEAKRGTDEYATAVENLYNLEVALATLEAGADDEKTEITKLDTLSERLAKIEKEYGAYKDAVSDMNELGIIQTDSLANLAETFPDLAKRLSKTSSGYVIATDSADKYLSTQEELLKQELRNAKTIEDKRIASRNLTDFMAIKATIKFTEEIERQTKAIEDQKEVLEDRKDALDDELDAYRDLIDKRKKLLETFKKEIDYRDELKNKQQNVSDLMTQVAVARLDTSEAGRAKVRELEAELNDAKEDLEDFNLDHTIESITSSLDEEYSMYEEMVSNEVSRIEEEIETLDEDVVGIAKEIRDKMDNIDFPSVPLKDIGKTTSGDDAGSVAIYHSGGTVGSVGPLKHNEEFAKLMDGEFVSTPKQIDNFINRTLPAMAVSGGGGVNYNAPIISIECETVTRESLPDLEKIVSEAANEVKRQLDGGMMRAGRAQPVGRYLR